MEVASGREKEVIRRGHERDLGVTYWSQREGWEGWTVGETQENVRKQRERLRERETETERERE